MNDKLIHHISETRETLSKYGLPTDYLEDTLEPRVEERMGHRLPGSFRIIPNCPVYEQAVQQMQSQMYKGLDRIKQQLRKRDIQTPKSLEELSDFEQEELFFFSDLKRYGETDTGYFISYLDRLALQTFTGVFEEVSLRWAIFSKLHLKRRDKDGTLEDLGNLYTSGSENPEDAQVAIMSLMAKYFIDNKAKQN